MSGPPPPKAAGGRLMIFDLDSLNQLQQWREGFDPTTGFVEDPAVRNRRAPRLSPVGALTTAGLEWFTGVIRTADLLSETILLTDAQLLDGIFFQALGVDRVLDLLGRRDVDAPPITVIGRAPSLEESLRAIAMDGLRGRFEYSTLSPLGIRPSAATDHAGLQRVATARVGDVAPVLAEVLGTLPGDAAGVDYCSQLGRSWQGWVRAEFLGLIRYEQFPPSRVERFAEIAAEWEPPPAPPTAQEAISQLAGTPQRTMARALLQDAVTDKLLPSTQRATVEAWWECIYADFVAENNGADWIDIFGGRFDTIGARRGESVGVRTTILRGRAPDVLGRMPNPRYSIFVWANRSALARFRAHRSQADMDAIAYAVQRADAETDLAGDRRSLLIGLAVSLGTVLIVFALGFVTSVPHAAWLVPLVVLLVTIGNEIFEAREPIRAVQRSSLRSTLYLRGAP